MEIRRSDHWLLDLSCKVANCKASPLWITHYWLLIIILKYFPGTPRTTAETYEEALKYGKQIKRESPPIRSFEGGIGKGKPYEGVNTIKEMGRSIHEIPRQDQSGQDICKTPDLSDRRVMEGSMSQVWLFDVWEPRFMDSRVETG